MACFGRGAAGARGEGSPARRCCRVVGVGSACAWEGFYGKVLESSWVGRIVQLWSGTRFKQKRGEMRVKKPHTLKCEQFKGTWIVLPITC